MNRLSAGLVAALILITLALHWQKLQVPFVWDDSTLLQKNHGLSSIREILVNPLFPNRQSDNYYRPIPFVLFSLVGQTMGFERPAPFQALHLFFIVVLAITVFALTARLFSPILAFWFTLLFVLFPTNLEAFAWLSSFPDTLVVLLWAWFAFQIQKDIGQKRNPSMLAIGILSLALFCKEGAIGFLPFAFLADWKSLSKERIFNFHAPLWITFTCYFLIHKLILSYTPPFYGNVNLSLKTLWAFVFKVFKPLPLSIIIGDRTTNFDWTVVAGAVLFLILLWLIVKAKDQRYRLGAALIISGYIPYSNLWLPPGDNYLIAERYMGPLVLGVMIIITTLVIRANIRVFQLSAAMLSVFFFGVGWNHYATWRAPKQLFQQAADLFPDKVSPVFTLAELAIEEHDWILARTLIERSLKNLNNTLDRFRGTKNGMIFVFNLAGHYDMARRIYFESGDFQQALDYARLYFNLSKQPADTLFGIGIIEHQLDFQRALAASINGNKAFPTDQRLAVTAIQHAVLGDVAAQAWDVVNRSSFQYVNVVKAALEKEDKLAALKPVQRAAALFDSGFLALSFSVYNQAATEMTPSELYDAGLRAFHERLWNQSERFFGLALLKESSAERFGWLGLSQQKLGRPQEACQSFTIGLRMAEEAHEDSTVEMFRKLLEGCRDVN